MATLYLLKELWDLVSNYSICLIRFFSRLLILDGEGLAVSYTQPLYKEHFFDFSSIA